MYAFYPPIFFKNWLIFKETVNVLSKLVIKRQRNEQMFDLLCIVRYNNNILNRVELRTKTQYGNSNSRK